MRFFSSRGYSVPGKRFWAVFEVVSKWKSKVPDPQYRGVVATNRIVLQNSIEIVSKFIKIRPKVIFNHEENVVILLLYSKLCKVGKMKRLHVHRYDFHAFRIEIRYTAWFLNEIPKNSIISHPSQNSIISPLTRLWY